MWCADAAIPSRRAAPSRAGALWSRFVRSATRFTQVSRRSSTAVAGWLASKGATASARLGLAPPRRDKPTNSWLTDARTVLRTAQAGRRFAFGAKSLLNFVGGVA